MSMSYYLAQSMTAIDELPYLGIIYEKGSKELKTR
jgi:hypothetical protein